LLVFLSELGVLAVKDVLKGKEPHREDGKNVKKVKKAQNIKFT
jgi:hypothetical protein